jgi:3-oxoacyl-[acyl-carrier protein] reductase
VGSASDVAEMVNFLASKDAKYITGQVFNVNGGIYP